MTGKFEYTGFEVYPLYDENDELKYFLVEFEPYGFVFVLLRDEQLKLFSWLGASTSMYKLSNLYGNNRTWSPYSIDETNSQPYPDTERIWELDENGEKIIHKNSPYKIAGAENVRRYLLCDSVNKIYYIPAIKIGEKYENLISMEEIVILDGQYTKKQATIYISFFVKKEMDL